MPVDLNIIIGGEAGQGVVSVGAVLGRVMVRGGYEVFIDQDFESRIRGGHSFTRVRLADHPVQSPRENADIVIALNAETIALHQRELISGGVLIYDGSKSEVKPDSGLNCLDIPMGDIATETAGSLKMANTVATAAALGLLGYDFDLLSEVLAHEYGRHGKKAVEANIKAARAGYDYAEKHRPKGYTSRLKAGKPSGKMLLTGNEAVALGALAAGCRFVAGYPMTPSTPILEYLADKGREFGIPVIQAEDEIAAINMAVGAGYAGARAMTATSGGGFSLMTEGLSLAGMTETPVVVVLGQRAGPATGLPTRTEQAELNYAINAGHGEFPRAVLAPANAEEAFWLTVKAFNLAEKYQTPVILLTDHQMADSYYTVAPFDLEAVKIEKGAWLSQADADRQGADYKRYAYTESGISPRALPGIHRALVSADSDEHSEAGHIIEDAETRQLMVDKRLMKQAGLTGEIAPPVFNRREKPEYTFVSWGSGYGPVAEAVEKLNVQGLKISHLHLAELWPFPAAAVTAMLKNGGKLAVIESNATGQLARLIRTETSLKADILINRYDGRPLSAAYIIDNFKPEARS
ncbi:MAG: 2-oxoacid:acceptor oxidoreductase subunit alpha [Dehalogenimonas sp.]